MRPGHRAWLAAAVCAAAGYRLLGRPAQLRWGATNDELEAALVGDDLVASADQIATRAITVRAVPDEVWPWVAQLGQSRGGFYSYDFLENLIGCEIHSADRINPEWQDLAAGDQVALAPGTALNVAVSEPGRTLVLRGGIPLGASASPPYDFTWAFSLVGLPGGATRLLVRERYGYLRSWTSLLVEPVEAVSFLMTRKMLRGIRARAEQASLTPQRQRGSSTARGGPSGLRLGLSREQAVAVDDGRGEVDDLAVVDS
jgi:hypothetical protein